MLSEAGKVDMSWRSEERLRLVEYAVLAGYQLALQRGLGSASNAFTQMLLGEVGDLLLDTLKELGVEVNYAVDNNNVGQVIEKVFRELGIARDIRVERLEDSVKAGRRLVRYRVQLRDSVFSPVHALLEKRGMRDYPISPEALLIGAILRKILRERDPRARVNVRTRLPQPGSEELEVVVEEIRPLSGQQ